MQINRMFEIIYLLMDKKLITAKELAQRFEVSTRTIYRDIETLSAAGIPVYMIRGKDGGISIMDNFVLNKTVLTDEEKSGILSSLRAFNALNLTETDSAVKKLGSLFGEGSSDWIEVDFSSWYNGYGEAELFNDIKSAILSRKIITFTYASGKGEQTKRQVEPLKLCFKGISRYLYAYCHTRQDFRFFKLSRIQQLVVTPEPFERKVAEPVFKDENYFQDEFVQLKLQLSPEAAFRVYDEFDRYTRQDDGSFIAEIVYPKGVWLFAYIFSFGGHCQVLEPPDIREQVIAELERMRANYL